MKKTQGKSLKAITAQSDRTTKSNAQVFRWLLRTIKDRQRDYGKRKKN